jgi:3-phosphoshikimate 1-carboxyvinyltransferase
MTTRERATVGPGRLPARWDADIPGSKSLTNRAVLLASLADGESLIQRPLVADDTLVMRQAVRDLGASIDESSEGLVVRGCGRAPIAAPDGTAVWCGMAGTAARFLLPVCAAGRGRFCFDADEQLRGRPMAALVDVLVGLCATVAPPSSVAFPFELEAAGLRGGDVVVDGSASSQFLSGLLLAAPYAQDELTVRSQLRVSRSYIDLTLDAMEAFGVTAHDDGDTIRVPVDRYRAQHFVVEPDVSTASYFLAIAALTATEVVVPGLSRTATRQGDVAFVEILEQMGCAVTNDDPLTLRGAPHLAGVEADMSNCSDVFMTAACVAAYCDGPSQFTGIEHIRAKESDRLDAVAHNLGLLGVRTDLGPGELTVYPGVTATATLPTYRDHRIAMAFSVMGARSPVEILDPDVVAKTCPPFFDLLETIGLRLVSGRPQAQRSRDADRSAGT